MYHMCQAPSPEENVVVASAYRRKKLKAEWIILSSMQRIGHA